MVSASDISVAKDVLGVGGAAVSLIEQVGKLLGAPFRPMLAKRDGYAAADVEAYRTIRIAQAQALADLIKSNDPEVLRQRAATRLLTAELKRQKNIEEVLTKAVVYLQQDAPTEVESLHADWLQKFIDFAQDVSDEDVQKIWAKMLARQSEVSARRISIMTLDTIRLMEPTHVSVFDRFARAYYTFGFALPFSYNQHNVPNFSFTYIFESLAELKLIDKFQLPHSDDRGEQVATFSTIDCEVAILTDQELRTPYPHLDVLRPLVRGFELACVTLPGKTAEEPMFDMTPSERRRNAESLMPLADQSEMLTEWFALLRYAGYRTIFRLKTRSETRESLEIAEWKAGRIEPSIDDWNTLLADKPLLKLLAQEPVRIFEFKKPAWLEDDV